MNGQTNFDCHDFFDNTNLCILEISLSDENDHQTHYEWLLINKGNLSIKKMQLKTQDGSSSIQERFFDLGFLKYEVASGVFIETAAKGFHKLEHKNCEDIPQYYLTAVNNYLNANLLTY